MKRVRCPKCDSFITFDEKRYRTGQSLVFVCPNCGKQFGIRIGVSALRAPQKEEQLSERQQGVGTLVVIENVFHYKQVLRLQLGENVIGRYMKGNTINCAIETNDPSIDLTHCIISVKKSPDGKLHYILRDGPSNTGTFVDNVILGDREQREIDDGTLFTIGATSILLKTPEQSSSDTEQ